MGLERRFANERFLREELVEQLARAHGLELARARDILRRAEQAADEDRSVREWFAILVEQDTHGARAPGKWTRLDAGAAAMGAGRGARPVIGKSTRMPDADEPRARRPNEIGPRGEAGPGLSWRLSRAYDYDMSGVRVWRDAPAPRGPVVAVQMKSLEAAERTAEAGSEQGLPDDGPGQPLPSDVQSRMERAFGVDFSAVRIYEGPRAEALGARAYTQGTEIHFAPGEYRPGSSHGEALLGHELAHVVQQSRGDVGQTTQIGGVGVNADTGLEQEADEMGARAARGEAARGEAARGAGAAKRLTPAPHLSATAAGAVQRMPYEKVRVGKWFRVRTDEGTVCLYLLTKRVGTGSEPPVFTFFRNERSRDNPVLIHEEARIEVEVAGPGGDPVGSMPGEPQGSTEAGPASSDPGRLGVISWNVAHLSKHDFTGSMRTLLEQLAKFPSRDLTAVFNSVGNFLNEIRNSFYVQEYLRLGPRFREQYEYDSTFNETFAHLQAKTDKVIQLSALVDKIQRRVKEFDAIGFLELLRYVVSVDWLRLYEKAKNDTSTRAELARKVAQLRNFADDVDSAKVVLGIIRQLESHTSTLQVLKCRDSALSLARSAAAVEVALMSLGKIRDLPSALHADNVVMHVREMFTRNEDWLDLVALHEVNDIAPLDQENDTCDIHHGPKMSSSGEKGQAELYPLLVRKGARIEVLKVYVAHTNGDMEETQHDAGYDWNKHKPKQKDKVYRPIVVYEIRKGGKAGQRYWVAVVHTTPESDSGISEFNRNKIFGEIKEGLQTLRAKAHAEKIPLVIGGDYYLTAEAVVKELSRADKQTVKDDEEDNDDYVKTSAKLAALQLQLEAQLKGMKSKQGNDTAKPKPGGAHGEQAEALLRERLKFVTEAQRDEQILRNLCKLTVAAQVKELGLFLAQPISGTNPKHNPLDRWFDLQIADFFIHNANLLDVNVGLVRPEGGLTTVDSEDLHDSRYWQHFSDHFPVGGVFSTYKRESQGRPDAFRGEGTDKAKRLARVSNRNRFARLQREGDKKSPDLSGLKDEEIEALAIQYLHGKIVCMEGKKAVRPAGMDECIARIQAGERRYPDGEPLFITEPGDFEPDSDHEGTPRSSEGPSTPGGQTRTQGGPGGPREERFRLDPRQQLQQGWNCGDIALKMTRDELVKWLLDNAGDATVRALLGPEIRTAAATSLMRGDFPEEEDVASKKATSKSSDGSYGNAMETSGSNTAQTLQQLFRLFDEAKEVEVRTSAASQIHDMLNEPATSKSSANQQGLPEAMRTPELRGLLQDYFNTNEAMREPVVAINDHLGLEVRRDGPWLGQYLADKPDLIQHLEARIYQQFLAKLAEFKQADQALHEYVRRPKVFRDYVEQYYGKQGWMVYHLDFGGADQASTSIIDLAAKFRATQVRVWVHRRGQFLLNRETTQYGSGVINVLYNGYNHFIGLTENPDYVPPDQVGNLDQ